MESTGVLPFVRGVDLSGNDFKVSWGRRGKATPRPSLRAAPSALPGPAGGAGGRASASLPGPAPPGAEDVGGGDPEVWGRAGFEPSGRKSDPMPRRELCPSQPPPHTVVSGRHFSLRELGVLSVLRAREQPVWRRVMERDLLVRRVTGARGPRRQVCATARLMG